jgi:hypothetical protein
MFIERGDLIFRDALARQVEVRLYGDDGRGGLLRGILACQSWDETNRTKGEIAAYEMVLTLMDEIVRRMNQGEDPARMIRNIN